MARWVPVRCLIPELLQKQSRKQNRKQTWLAAQIGISRQNLQDYIKMRNGLTMGLSLAKTAANTLGCSIDDLYVWDYLGDGRE